MRFICCSMAKFSTFHSPFFHERMFLSTAWQRFVVREHVYNFLNFRFHWKLCSCVLWYVLIAVVFQCSVEVFFALFEVFIFIILFHCFILLFTFLFFFLLDRSLVVSWTRSLLYLFFVMYVGG